MAMLLSMPMSMASMRGREAKTTVSTETAARARRRARAVLFLCALAAAVVGSGHGAAAPSARAAADDAAAAGVPLRVILVDGGAVDGRLRALADRRLSLEGRDEPIGFHELREISFPQARGAAAAPGSAASAASADDAAQRAFVRFTGGEILAGRLLDADARALRLVARGPATRERPAGEDIGEIAVPLASLRAFRLREANPTDAIFEETLAGPPPAVDHFFVRRGSGLIRIEGVFRSLDGEEVVLEYRGETQSIRRERVLGVVFAAVAGRAVPRGDEATVVLHGGSRIPAVLTAIVAAPAADGGARIRVDLQGSSWEIAARHVDALRFASDRIRFLSDIEPARVSEAAFLGEAFPHRRDVSVSGAPLSLGGVAYRKGLGVHSRSTLEWTIEEACESFVARVGIDDSVGRRGAATVRVLGNGRKLFEAEVRGGGEPVDVVVPLLGVRSLALETDFGPDGTDLADHVDWVDARLVKPAAEAAGARPPAESPAGETPDAVPPEKETRTP